MNNIVTKRRPVAVIISVDSLLISYYVSKLAVNSWQPGLRGVNSYESRAANIIHVFLSAVYI
jgi:hypothetical protein